MRKPFSTIGVCLLSAVLAGCSASSGSREQAKPDIGAAPPYAAEVQVREPAKGESPVVAGERYRAGLDKANTIIRCMVKDRADTRAAFLGEGVAKPEPETCAQPADAAQGRTKARAKTIIRRKPAAAPIPEPASTPLPTREAAARLQH